MQNFEGIQYRLANNWFAHVDINEFKHIPIKYLEIGTFYGANLLSVANSYASHTESKLYCIDPWEDYDEYDEYKNQQGHIFETCMQNIKMSGFENKIIIKRGFSHIEVPQFQDEYFDIIYIDGNHNPEYVLEDAILSFRKLKQNGILIFDDYGWGGPDLTKRGIDAFLSAYHKKIQFIGEVNTQIFVRKIN